MLPLPGSLRNAVAAEWRPMDTMSTARLTANAGQPSKIR
ncbi:hypothetical protein T261_04698 [Streptomyces lydicus]|nr:hypothetical protein T261_04698 [Streptomyces lydicus]